MHAIYMTSDMENKYSFLRKIAHSTSGDELEVVFKSLSNEGLEVYINEDKSGYKLVGSWDDFLDNKTNDNTLYIAAADMDFAVSLLKVKQLDYLIPKAIFIKDCYSDKDKIMEAYYKKRKWTLIEVLVIVGIAIIFMLIKN